MNTSQSKSIMSSKKVVIVNGPPASGKSTIAEALMRTLHLQLLSLDRIKEALFNELGTGDREYNRHLGRASMAVIWSLLNCLPLESTIIIEAWFKFPPHDWVTQALFQAGVTEFVEIWCYAPPSVLATRYVERVGIRHEGHPGAEYASELIEIAKRANPMSISPVMRINTAGHEKNDIKEIAKWITLKLSLQTTNDKTSTPH